MAERTVANIDAIDNIITMAQTMATLGIPADGLTTLCEMKAKAKEQLISSQTNTTWTAGKAFSVLSETRDEDARKRKILLKLYETTLKYLKTEADERLIRLLNSNLASDVKHEVRKHQKFLEVKEYVVLVAGESSAGKSSLVNLILGEELLPSHLLCTTSTICELRYGEVRRIVCHYKKGAGEHQRMTEITLRDPHEADESYLDQISPFMHIKDERERGSPFEKVELYWPHDLLKKGIVIVDSPGIGESEIMDGIVTSYLSHAFCFIYVINSTNAGGIHKDRIVKLFQGAQKNCEDREESLLCESALFVCNKWDGVPKGETTDVKQHIIKKLMKCWPNLKHDSQVIYMSTTAAAVAQGHGVISEDFKILIDSVKHMVLRAIDARLQTYSTWLDYVISRVIYHTKAFIHNAARDREAVSQKLRDITERVEQIELNHKMAIHELHEQLNAKIDELVEQLYNHLMSEAAQTNLMSWTNDDAPAKQEDWSTTEYKIDKAIQNRFREEIAHWEEQTKVFSMARQCMKVEIETKLSFLQGQLDNVEESLASSSYQPPVLINPGDELTTGIGFKILLGITFPIWIPLGLLGLVLGLPVLGIIATKDKIEDVKQLKRYDRNRSGCLAEKSREYYNNLVSSKSNLRDIVKKYLAEVEVYLRAIKTKLPAIIEANKMLLMEFLVEAIAKKESHDHYLPINAKFLAVRGKLAVFLYEECKPADISTRDLSWQENQDSCLGRGTFAAVYSGTLERNGAKKPVALKIFNKALVTANAYQFLVEETILRSLSHPNIVKFHGTALLRVKDATRIIFVMELCSENLKTYLVNHCQSIPGKKPEELSSAIKMMIQRANNICLALNYIHNKGVIHRDLKTENILVSDAKGSAINVKIADVGISKKIDEVTGTFVGSPVYIAPEIFQSSMYDSKADIYSFALVLWEMWYGGTAYFELLAFSAREFSNRIVEGYRPHPPDSCMPPPPGIGELMTQCWDPDPRRRPSADIACSTLNEMLKTLNV